MLSDFFIRIESSPWRVDKAETTYLRAQLKIAEDELRRLDADLAMLLANRSGVIRRINRYRMSLAPCSKLPAELIGEIFLLCVPTVCKLPMTRGEKDPRMHITQICSSWRNIAFGTPNLWNVHLERTPEEKTVDLIAAWFHQCFSTYIGFTMSSMGWDPQSSSRSLFEKVIIPNARRFKTLHCSLQLHPDEWSSLSFDILTSLSLCSVARRAEPGTSLNAPFIRNLEVTEAFCAPLYRDNLTFLQCLPKVTWEQLTSISLTGSLPFSDVYDVLFRCTSLESCKLDNVHEDSARPTPTGVARIGLPHLKELWIRVSYSAYFPRMSLFNTPNLASLATSLPPNKTELLEPFIFFIVATTKALHTFEILSLYEDTRASDGKIMGALSRAVTKFLAKEQPIALSVLAQIGTGELLPKLEVLEFAVAVTDTVDDALDALMPRRSNRTLSFRSICIHVDRYQHYNPWRRIEDLCSQGINVHVAFD